MMNAFAVFFWSVEYLKSLFWTFDKYEWNKVNRFRKLVGDSANLMGYVLGV